MKFFHTFAPMNMQDIEIVKNWLNKNPKISIIPHRNPDGDAMGSCLALYLFLKKNNPNVAIVSPTDYPDFLKWLPSNNEVIIFSEKQEDALNWLQTSEIIFTLDFNHLGRIEPLTKILENSKAKFVMIDHHQQPDSYADVTFSFPTASSTCEIMYSFLNALENNAITKEIATCLYTGIMTDTGCFKYALTTAHTHQITAHLIEQGISVSQINTAVFDSSSHHQLLLLGKALDNMIFLPQYKTAYTSLSSKELKQFHFQKGDTEGFVNYGLKIKEAQIAVIFIEEESEGIIKMSFRSKNNIDVNVFARTYFNGGGHINASGGKFDGTIQEAISYFLKVLPEFYSQQTF